MKNVNKLKEYEIILTRLDKASEYFSKLSNEDIDKIESTKEYKLLGKLIYKANELYMELKDSGLEI